MSAESRWSRAAAEFSRPVPVATLRPGGETVTLAASEAEREVLARRLGVEAVREAGAEFTLRPRGRGVVSVRGRVRAVLGRYCVVSLAPLDEVIDETVRVLFRPEEDGEADGEADGEVSLDAEAEDEEPYAGAEIDLGEFAAQTIALVLNPWPRAQGASLPPEAGGA